MKLPIYASLLALSAVCAVPAFAQSADVKRDAAEAKRDAADAKREMAEDARTRAKLEEARERLDKAAREVAELSGELGANARREVHIFRTGGPDRAVLGIQIEPGKSKNGVRVLSVSPGGPASEAGILADDVIVSLDGVSMADHSLIAQMGKVKPDQKVKVKVLRAGKNKDLLVIARPMAPENAFFRFNGPEFETIEGLRAGIARAPEMGQMRRFQFFGNEFSGLELASITPKLGAYFGATDGVLVVSAPESDSFKLEDGDVIQSIDGRKPEDGGHALRILRSYKSGEKLNLTVLRQRKPLTLAVTMPERPAFDEHMMGPPMPAVPLPPPAPPGAKGSFE
ncbi:MAG: PDZ domain-containing protein [Steroidobacteraceae bacterium]|nr:PDZ domain-containing protein [Steroidobacteraceae bacterium]